MSGTNVVEPATVDPRAAVLLQTIAANASGLLHDLLNPEPLTIDLTLHDGDSQLRELRAAMPRRQLSLDEGIQLAERQASLLRWQLGHGQATALTNHDIASLPFLKVEARVGLSKSALVTRTDTGWVIVLNADEPRVRRRFSLCHEIKHILDDPLVQAQAPRGLYPASAGLSSEDNAERVCDQFAAALLMPKVLLRRDWTNRIQDPARLAQRYQVSRAAMEVRLYHLGLGSADPRRYKRSWSDHSTGG